MMDKGCGGGEELGDGMQCSNHPYRSSPGGICAFCLQEKLGKLVSSSKSNSFFPISSSSSASPSFRSAAGASSFHLKAAATKEAAELKRSKSSAAPRHLLDAPIEYITPRKRGFWSFIHLPSSSSRRGGGASSSSSSIRDKGGDAKPSIHPTPTANALVAAQQQNNSKDKSRLPGGEASSSKRGGDYGDENESPNSSSSGHASSSSFGRKVARSRSVGCGSRSFSGDFLERLSTGFGDCTVLRRVESQREAKPSKAAEDHQRMKERVKCGGIFGGFGMTLTSAYWASTTATNVDAHNARHHHHHQRQQQRRGGGATNAAPHGRTKSWGWSFASPMRALMSKAEEDYSKDRSGNAATCILQQHAVNKRNTAHRADSDADAAVHVPNLAAIPSLLTVRS